MAAFKSSLSLGCLSNIMTGVDVDKPVIQILGLKRIASADGVERYRLLISDGQYFNTYAMLGTQLNPLVPDLVDFSIIKVTRYTTSVVNKNEGEKRVLIIIEAELLHSGNVVGEKIGNPISYADAKSSTQMQPSASTSLPPSGINTSSHVNNNQNNIIIKEGGNNDTRKRSYTAMMSNGTHNQSLADITLTHPISGLSPYQNKWVIKARVSSKSAIRTWSNAKGEGKLFSMDLVDESGQIRCTGFREAVDKFYDMIEVDKVYYISKCQLKVANKQFTTIKNDYEMTITNDTVIQLCEDAVDSIPNIKYEFVPISQIANIEPNSMVDIIGICSESSDVQQFTARSSGRDLKKRDVTLVDDSNASVVLTLWGDDAENFDGFPQPVVLCKGARVQEFAGGKSISLIGGSVMKINPDISEGHKLRGWFDNGGSSNVSKSVSSKTGAGSFNTEWLSFYDAKTKKLGQGDKPDYFQVKGFVQMVRNANALYKACPQPDCNKKVIDQDNFSYRCEKCSRDFPNFKYRLMINLYFGDWIMSNWITLFSDLAEKVYEKTAQEIGELSESDNDAYEKLLSSIIFKGYIFKIRIKLEHYGDTPRIKMTAVSAAPINYKEYNTHLIKELQELTGMGKN